MISSKEILDEAGKIKENMPSPLSANSLGRVIKDVWSDRVKIVRKGSKVGARQRMYLNLRRKNTERDVGFVPPKGWIPVAASDEGMSFSRFESWELDGQRVTTELTVEKTLDGTPQVNIKCHGTIIDAKDLEGTSSTMSTEANVTALFDFVGCSDLCKGFSLRDGEVVSSILPHSLHVYKDLTMANTTQESRVFSESCKIFSQAENLCVSCSHLARVDSVARKRKQAQGGHIPKNCNNRFLSKTELEEKLKDEKRARENAGRRENYWRDKFAEEMIEVEDGDHNDFEQLFRGVDAKDIPENMKCLWDQQAQVLLTTSKRGYRWHPKYVSAISGRQTDRQTEKELRDRVYVYTCARVH